jgi:hypothetical protein
MPPDKAPSTRDKNIGFRMSSFCHSFPLPLIPLFLKTHLFLPQKPQMHEKAFTRVEAFSSSCAVLGLSKIPARGNDPLPPEGCILYLPT